MIHYRYGVTGAEVAYGEDLLRYCVWCTVGINEMITYFSYGALRADPAVLRQDYMVEWGRKVHY